MNGDAGAAGHDDRPAAGVPRGRAPWRGRYVVLGVTGGIAAYKSIHLARSLTQLGARVDVVMTRAAREFVGPISFEAVTGRPVLADIMAEGNALAHIRVARDAAIVCVAPATADFLARVAHGRSDDLLTAIVMATRAPVLVCPAMNDRMWSHPQVQANAARLAEFGHHLFGPATGELAFGEGHGPGRMEEPESILQHIGRLLGTDAGWAGRRVIVTAGPTREAVDAVRVLSNRSSGKMGFAIAAAAWRRGADVTLIAGPTAAEPPVGPAVLRVETAREMADVVGAQLPAADVLFMAAAVADFRPAAAHTEKIKKHAGPLALELEPAPDVLRETRALRAEHAIIVGFALETGDGREYARAKLRDKGLHLVVLNSASEPDAGFDVDTNRVTILSADGEDALPLMSKDDVAEALLDRTALLLPPRA